MRNKIESEDSAPYMDVRGTAELLKTTPKAVYCMHQEGLLPGGRKLGRRLLFNRGEVIRWIESCAASSER